MSKELTKQPNNPVESMGWLGMDDAPRDGTLLLGYDREGDYWLIKFNQYDHVWMEEDLLVYPMGWQPLPSVPNRGINGKFPC